MVPTRKERTSERYLAVLVRPDDFAEEGTPEDEAEIDAMCDELAEAIGIEFED